MTLKRALLTLALVAFMGSFAPTANAQGCSEPLCWTCTVRNGWLVCKVKAGAGACDCYADVQGCHLIGGACYPIP